MTTPHVIASSSSHPSHSLNASNLVGGHYRAGKKIGEGSFGVVFEGCLASLAFFSFSHLSLS
jgi:casein kinase 1